MPEILHPLLKAASQTLRDADVGFAVVGGMAVAARALARFTADIDLAVAVTDDREAEATARLFLADGYAVATELDNTRTHRLATLRLRPPARAHPGIPPDRLPLLDLLFATSGIEPECVAQATELRFAPGLTLPTARIPHLIAMKCLSESDDRLQDRIDLQYLTASATAADLAQVPALLNLITERGYAGDKDLPAVLRNMTKA